MALRENMGFHNVQVLLMELIFLLSLRLNAQPTTTTVRGGIPIFYKVYTVDNKGCFVDIYV